MTKREALAIARERDVRFVRLCFSDIMGVAKNVTVPVSRLADALDGKVAFDGGSIDGFARGEELDMLLKPAASTFAIYPWTSAGVIEARILCDIANPDGEPFEGCPRTTLQRVIEDSRDVLAGVRVGLEVEFYLFEGDGVTGPPHTSDVGGYFDLNPTDRGEEARMAIVAALESMGVPIASAHHEHGRGQHEIDLMELEPLDAADALATMRTVARHVAASMGLNATFMPKPSESLAGSGVHVYLRFPGTAQGDSEREAEIDESALFAIGGLIAHAPAFTAICNPTVNSYKRIVAAFDAPIYASWSYRSPNSLVRVPEGADHGKVLEIRSPDPACNPYLALASLFASAADGVRKHLLAGEPLEGSTYELNERERSERRIVKLPRSLRQAIDELEKDSVVKNALGDHLYQAFRDVKHEEYERYRRAVHPWERDAYLRTF